MPWDAKSFKKHNKGLSEGQADQASHVANAIMEESGDEGKAIRIANWQAKKKRRQGKKRHQRPEMAKHGEELRRTG